jgi:hypothetical protein
MVPDDSIGVIPTASFFEGNRFPTAKDNARLAAICASVRCRPVWVEVFEVSVLLLIAPHRCESCEAVRSPSNSSLEIRAQLPSPCRLTAAISSSSSSADHFFLLFRGAKLLANPFPLCPSAAFGRKTGKVIFIPLDDQYESDGS